MSYLLLRESFTVARKRHQCIWCAQSIEKGEKHRHEISTYDGIQDFRWHLECNDAANDYFADGEAEFLPHSNERPARSTTEAER